MKPSVIAKKTARPFPEAAGRKDASVIKHGSGPAVPNQQWEMNLDATPAGNGEWPSASFLPMAGKDRAQPHTKINECDH